MSATSLVIFTADGLALNAAVEAFRSLGSRAAIGLFYQPAACKLARLDDAGRLSEPNGKPVDLSPVFEARIFHESIELRWLKDPSSIGSHRAVILGETDLSPKLSEKWTRLEIGTPVIGTLEQTYLLWGEGTGESPSEGWSELATPRIGPLPVPIRGVAEHDRVMLITREYLAEYDHGNVAVFDERLLRLEVKRG